MDRDTHNMNTLNARLAKILEVPAATSEDAHRGKMLNIMLIIIGGAAAFTILMLQLTTLFRPSPSGEGPKLLLVASWWLIGGIAAIYLLNRYVSRTLASSLFITLILFLGVISDTPAHVAEGRALLIFIFPIIAASVLIRPWAGFVVAALSSIIIATISLRLESGSPDIPSMIGFFLTAALIWLATSYLERALKDLRRAYNSLEKSEEKYRVLIENANETIIVVQEGMLAFANPQATELTGYSQDELLAIPFSELILPDDQHSPPPTRQTNPQKKPCQTPPLFGSQLKTDRSHAWKSMPSLFPGKTSQPPCNF